MKKNVQPDLPTMMMAAMANLRVALNTNVFEHERRRDSPEALGGCGVGYRRWGLDVGLTICTEFDSFQAEKTPTAVDTT